MDNIFLKRIYEKPSDQDGYRILVDRLWPRGVKKEDAGLDAWDKDLAPTSELRKWFNHQPEKFPEFTIRYKEELISKTEELQKIIELSKKGRVCLLFAAKDEAMNQAIVLKSVLDDMD
jgi:uncharacterized protein YeaO (DUF488 family)